MLKFQCELNLANSNETFCEGAAYQVEATVFECHLNLLDCHTLRSSLSNQQGEAFEDV